MRTKRLVSLLLSCSMLAASAVSAFAAAPSAYDGKPYTDHGLTSNDPDGQINLAVIADEDVKIVGDAMYILGSVYSNGKIYVGNGQGNKIDGLFISGTEDTVFASTEDPEWAEYRTAAGYIHVNSKDPYKGTTEGINYYSVAPEYEGAIYDPNTSFECSYKAFTVPTIANDLGDVQFNVYGQDGSAWGGANTLARTISEDTHIGTLEMNGSQNKNDWQPQYGMVIDTTAGDVTVVIENLVGEWGQAAVNPSIQVVGDNDAYIYINNVEELKDLAINYDTTIYDENWQWAPEIAGSVDNTHVYITGGDVVLDAGKIAVADLTVNAKTLDINGATTFYGDIYSNAEKFTITGGQTEVYGIVCVPNADSEVVDSGTLYGQLHTKTLTQNGAGRILWQADTAVAKSEATPEPTVEPEEEPTPEVTPAPLPSDDPIELSGGYAYIFGDEPGKDEDGNTIPVIYMSPNREVSREEVSAMIMRMIDQEYDTKGITYSVSEKVQPYAGLWFERGLAYMDSKNAFEGMNPVWLGHVTRGEVAKLIALGLNLDANEAVETGLSDVAGSKYEAYINIVYGYGYMQGQSANEFGTDKYMTRAEFCQLFNNIIGRTAMGLTTADGTVVTPATYSIVDLDGHWAEEAMTKATSAYDSNGNVDLDLRQSNIRNVLDNYDDQTDL